MHYLSAWSASRQPSEQSALEARDTVVVDVEHEQRPVEAMLVALDGQAS